MARLEELPRGPAGTRIVGGMPKVGATTAECEAILSGAAALGPLVRLGEGGPEVLLAVEPSVIQEVFLSRAMVRPAFEDPFYLRVLGQALATMPGEEGDAQRRLVGPAFSKKAVAGYASPLSELCAVMGGRWGDSAEVEMDRAFREVAYKATAQTIVGIENQQWLEQMYSLYTQMTTVGEGGEAWRARFLGALEDYEARIYRVIADLRARPSQTAAMGRLMAVEGRTDAQLRDDIVSLLFNGTATMAAALAYTLAWLAARPQAQEMARAEVRSGITEAGKMGHLQAALHETLRLNPPSWIESRVAAMETAVGGVVVPAGTHVLMSEWVTQRDGRWWARPLEWWPERWRNGSLRGLPDGAFFPFGGGRRRCMGEALAIMHMPGILGEMLRGWHWSVVADKPWRFSREDLGEEVAVWLRAERLDAGIGSEDG